MDRDKRKKEIAENLCKCIDKLDIIGAKREIAKMSLFGIDIGNVLTAVIELENSINICKNKD